MAGGADKLSALGGSGASTAAQGLGNVQLDDKQNQMLAMQKKQMEESEMFSTISNIMKSKHDSHMVAIGNLK